MWLQNLNPKFVLREIRKINEKKLIVFNVIFWANTSASSIQMFLIWMKNTLTTGKFEMFWFILLSCFAYAAVLGHMESFISKSSPINRIPHFILAVSFLIFIKTVKIENESIKGLILTNCLSVIDYFVGLAFKGLSIEVRRKNNLGPALLTFSCIILKNGQTHFKNLAVWTSEDFKSIFGHFPSCMEGLKSGYKAKRLDVVLMFLLLTFNIFHTFF